EHRGERSRRDREVERGVAADPVRVLELDQLRGQRVEGVVVVEGTREEAERVRDPLPDLRPELGARVLLGRFARECLELADAPVTSREPQQYETRWQQSPVAQVIYRRNQLLPC